MNYQQSFLIGNLTKDPETFSTQNGSFGCKFTLAINRHFMKDGEKVKDVTYVPITCWSSLSDAIKEILSKGDTVMVIGWLKNDKWQTKDGEKRQSLSIVAEKVIFVKVKKPFGKPQNQVESDQDPSELGNGEEPMP